MNPLRTWDGSRSFVWKSLICEGFADLRRIEIVGVEAGGLSGVSTLRELEANLDCVWPVWSLTIFFLVYDWDLAVTYVQAHHLSDLWTLFGFEMETTLQWLRMYLSPSKTVCWWNCRKTGMHYVRRLGGGTVPSRTYYCRFAFNEYSDLKWRNSIMLHVQVCL